MEGEDEVRKLWWRRLIEGRRECLWKKRAAESYNYTKRIR